MHFLIVDVVKDRIDILIDLWFGIPSFFNTFLLVHQDKVFQELPLRSKFFDVPRLSAQKYWGSRLLIPDKQTNRRIIYWPPFMNTVYARSLP